MDPKQLVNGKNGEKLFLLGNEAAVRGALESGVSIAATYPGTPSSEIGNELSKIAKEAGLYFEFSINEKVALEVAAAAAASGVRSFTFMKHVGVNVASDSLMSAVYTGVRGGMVILVADEPSMFSSQNEQDTRHYNRLANFPLLEPSNPHEIKEFIKYGFELSEKFQIPVLIRTTTRTSHMRGIVELGHLSKPSKKGYFIKNPSQFVPVPSTARVMHQKLVEKMDTIKDEVNSSDLNRIHNNKKTSPMGIISSGSAFNYVMDVINGNNLDIPVLKLGFSYPFPEEKVLEFMENLDAILVVEEVDPIMEKEILSILGQRGIKKTVHGKLDKTLPLIYEFNPDIVAGSLKKLGDYPLKSENKDNLSSTMQLPNRPPTLCAGCPHRAAYYAIIKARENLGIEEDDMIFPTDIGCYTLGIESPYNAGDYLLSMGSGIGASCGFSRATDQKIVSFIGDSTFFHAGIPPLVNAVHNKHNFVLTVLDNRTTAMTGGQPHPGLPVDGMGEVAPEISIEKIAAAAGADLVETINPLNLKNSIPIFEKAIQNQGVSVVISKYPCMLIKGIKKPKKLFLTIDTEKCDDCLECVSQLSCPAIFKTEDGSIKIDNFQCRGCTICLQMCPQKAIRGKR